MILESLIDTNSDEFKKNKNALLQHINQWRDKVEMAKKGGGEEATKKHKSRGKLTARERIARNYHGTKGRTLWSSLMGSRTSVVTIRGIYSTRINHCSMI